MALRWRGDRWADERNFLGDVRLLVLGEAHYHDSAPIGTDLPDMTQYVVEDFLAGHHSYPFFTKVGRLVTGRGSSGLTREETRAFWHSVIFYNYIPVVAANTPGARPPEHLWYGDAPGAFLELVRREEVEAVLVCGTELWRRMPTGLPSALTYEAAGRSWQAREYEVALPYRAAAAHIPHPTGSSGWGYGRCQPVVDFLFAQVNAMRVAMDLDPASLPGSQA